MITITQTVDLSLNENLVPAVIHVKQYDNLTRKIICRLYLSSTLISLDSSVSVNISGTRPDGCFFQYSSCNDADIVFVENGCACFWVTDVMTSSAGRCGADVTLADENGSILGTFSLMFHVERAAVENKGLTSGSYSALVESFTGNISSVYIDDDGYLVIEIDDGLGITVAPDGGSGVVITY